MAERRDRLAREHDAFRSAVVNEPRGSDPLVGALLCPPNDPGSLTGVIFFNNVGYLGMCGHGTIGVVTTLAHLGHLAPGEHRLETPVGPVRAALLPDGCVRFRNVPSYRFRHSVPLTVPGHGEVTGDVAWGGNWFFLVSPSPVPIDIRHLTELQAFSVQLRRALERAGVTGRDGAPIDHIELADASPTPGMDSRNFVLCPGLAYDRSPCGTGTSARLACLYADGAISPGETWHQESVVGSQFEGRIILEDGHVLPEITGAAYITAEATLTVDPRDPFRHGLPRT
jgi:proline racemase